MDPKTQTDMLQNYAVKGELIDPHAQIIGGTTPARGKRGTSKNLPNVGQGHQSISHQRRHSEFSEVNNQFRS